MSAEAAREYLSRARTLTQKAEALGATLASWSALTLAFSWDPDAIEEAIDLAATLKSGVAAEQEAWACGIAQGEMALLAPTGARADLAWGEPLIISLTLSRIARPGEVMLHASVKAALDGLLNTMDPRRASDAGVEVLGLPLDCASPWKRASAGRYPSSRGMGAVGVRVASVNPRPEALAPSPLPVAPSPAPPRTSPLVAISQPVEGLGTSSQTTDADIGVVDPEALSARLMQLTTEALVEGDAQSLERWSEGPEAAADEADSFVQRMRTLARLSKGPVGDALRTLQVARRQAEGAPSTARCQASLALGVGLAFAGRVDEALLEGLDALARAREGHDDKAVTACIAFLAKLFASVNRAEDARVLTSMASTPPPPLQPI